MNGFYQKRLSFLIRKIQNWLPKFPIELTDAKIVQKWAPPIEHVGQFFDGHNWMDDEAETLFWLKINYLNAKNDKIINTIVNEQLNKK